MTRKMEKGLQGRVFHRRSDRTEGRDEDGSELGTVKR